jgi:hypothetical protein
MALCEARGSPSNTERLGLAPKGMQVGVTRARPRNAVAGGRRLLVVGRDVGLIRVSLGGLP